MRSITVEDIGRRFCTDNAASTVNNLRILERLLESGGAKRTLEIGLGPGASAVLFAAFHQTNGHMQQSHTAIDPYQKISFESRGLAALEAAGLGAFVRVLDQFSSVALPRLVDAGERFDLIYVDGSHLFEHVFVDAFYGLTLLNPGGIIAFDDCRYRDVAKVVKFIQNNGTGAVREIDLSAYRRGLSYRLARYLNRVQMRAFKRIENAAPEWNSPFGRPWYARMHRF